MTVLSRPGRPRGLLVAVATVAVATALLRSPFGTWGLDAIVRSDGEPMVRTVAFTTAIWLVAAAVGGWAAAPREGFAVPGEANTAALTVTAALAMAAPLMLLVAGGDSGSLGGVLLGALALELATVAGGLLGLACLRGYLPGPVVPAAVLALLSMLAARAALIGVSDPVALITPAGQVTEHALAALRDQERRLPPAMGAAAALATAICAQVIGRGRALPPVAAVPIVLRAAGVLLGALWAGTPVFSAGPAVEWLYLASGGAAGALTGLARRGRPERTTAPRYG